MDFINGILPGNYWLTKSMEFVKKDSSGTLWYLKKWIVYYNYIFFKDSLNENDYKEIKNIFLEFINSLDASVQQDAKNFFFKIDIESGEFIRLSNFINSNQHFNDDNERRAHTLNAKKFYFSYVMDAGGQAGYKKIIKDSIVTEGCYDGVINNLKQVLTDRGDLSKLNQQINDFHAFLRNERQIFFYYGFFHGKESADLSGFYSLTNIGKTIIKANFFELIIIWEHQKLRMVSQSPVADIKNLNKQENIDYSKFSTLNHPYLTFLKILNKNSNVSASQYQYVISKINNNTDIEYLSDNILNNDVLENDCKIRAESFLRSSEVNEEDFLKEIKKFILGICVLEKDNNSNFFEFTSWVNAGIITITNQERANFIVSNYETLSLYLDNKNNENYKIFESELKNKYLELIDNRTFEIDDNVKYEWYKYIINYDKNLYLNLIYLSISLRESNFTYGLSVNQLESYYNDYKFILLSFGISKQNFKTTLVDIQHSLQINKTHVMEENEDYVSVNPRAFSETINMERLAVISAEVSSLSSVNTSLDRKRSSVLINSMRSFYFNNYANPTTNLIKCDCCNSTTFLTDYNKAYLEFHHLIPFSTDFGPDHYLNLFGICPNCHRKLHFLNKEEKVYLYENLSSNNNMNKEILLRVNTLFQEKVLEPIHLDFLKKEKIITTAQYSNLVNNLSIITTV